MSPSASRTAPRCHHYHQSPLVPVYARVPSPSAARVLPFAISFLSSLPLAHARLFARSLAHTPMRAHARPSHIHTFVQTHSLSLPPSLSLCLSYYPPTGSLFLRVTTQWRCHTLAPSSNQCYCFIVPLLLLLLDTRKGDPSIPESGSGTPRSRRFDSPCPASPRLVSRRTKARAVSWPSRAKRYEALYGPTRARIRSPRISR